MTNTMINEKSSTSTEIAKLGLSARQRNRALADLAVVDNLMGAIYAVSKLLHLR